ncbi:HAD family phosphatase [Erysipelothrix sp. HDW6B]|uniref:HAD family hydrolase n=1 Tax=Erysipelothrix TaxID=1647 RepID=UPI00135BDE56|nr:MULTISPECIES: HAD family phosphatase [Erysipelothrix]QIK85110.1 HAD family phosphatase [Erysipelothrix sp. HDW6B]
MIRHFIFDMGNVLIDFNPDYILSHFTTDIHELGKLKSYVFGGDTWLKLDNGDISIDDAYSEIAARAPELYHETLHEIVHSWSDYTPSREAMIDLIENLKEQGYSLHLCSNAANTFYDYKHKIKALELFDSITISADINISKPKPGIYEHVLKENNLSPLDCIFVDDSMANVQAASKLGMHGFHYTGSPDILRKYLTNLKLL